MSRQSNMLLNGSKQALHENLSGLAENDHVSSSVGEWQHQSLRMALEDPSHMLSEWGSNSISAISLHVNRRSDLASVLDLNIQYDLDTNQTLDRDIPPELRRVELQMSQLTYGGRGISGLALLFLNRRKYKNIIFA